MNDAPQIELMDLVAFSEIVNGYCAEFDSKKAEFDEVFNDHFIDAIEKQATIIKPDKRRKLHKVVYQSGFMSRVASEIKGSIYQFSPIDVREFLTTGEELVSKLYRVRSESEVLVDFAFVRNTLEYVDISQELFETLVEKVIGAAGQFNQSLQEMLGAECSKRLEGGEILNRFELDLQLANYALEQLPLQPYAKENALYALKIAQAITGVKNHLENVLARIRGIKEYIEREVDDKQIYNELRIAGFKKESEPFWVKYDDYEHMSFSKSISGAEFSLREANG